MKNKLARAMDSNSISAASDPSQMLSRHIRTIMLDMKLTSDQLTALVAEYVSGLEVLPTNCTRKELIEIIEKQMGALVMTWPEFCKALKILKVEQLLIRTVNAPSNSTLTVVELKAS